MLGDDVLDKVSFPLVPRLAFRTAEGIEKWLSLSAIFPSDFWNVLPCVSNYFAFAPSVSFGEGCVC